MHFTTLRHVRDHAKTVGPARHLLIEIATHVNYHTGEAFELSVDRLAHRLDVTPQWTRQLLHTLIASGELVVERSRGRHANVYRIPYERCHACQAAQSPRPMPPDANPKLEFPVDLDPDQSNPKLDSPQPETQGRPTRNSGVSNAKLAGASARLLARVEPPKEDKDAKERKDYRDAPCSLAQDLATGTPHPTPARWRRCGWASCDQPVCPHEVNFCAGHAGCARCPPPTA